MFNNKVTFQKDAETDDTIGGVTLEGSDVTGLINLPCRLQPMSGKERFVAGKERVFMSHVLFLRIPSVDIKEEYSASVGSHVFDILYIKNWDEDNVYFRLDLLERN